MLETVSANIEAPSMCGDTQSNTYHIYWTNISYLYDRSYIQLFTNARFSPFALFYFLHRDYPAVFVTYIFIACHVL